MTVLRASIRAAVVLAAVVVLVSSWYAWDLARSADLGIRRIPGAVRAPSVLAPGSGSTFLVIGSDVRLGADEGGGVEGERSDALMLVRVTPGDGAVNVLSIPRDAWVEVPGHGEAKINAALAWGGVPLAVRTVEAVAGIAVDHVVEIGFGALRDLTTLLGGVRVVLPEESTDPLTRTTFDAGENVLEGDRALTFVRQRYGLPRGDLDRIARQHQLLTALLARIGEVDPLRHPVLLDRLTEAAASGVAIDEALTVPELITLADRLSALRPGLIRYATAAVGSVGGSPDGQSVVHLDGQAFAVQCAALAGDRPVPEG
ncbi:LCP family protein [Actinosynnema sp. NPDC020468]|uniref:LCP family protein n=1 Tax=Actinosynnema sp. NPDC020468 TaxID=3154488 RepID=UPI0033C86BD4